MVFVLVFVWGMSGMLRLVVVILKFLSFLILGWVWVGKVKV